MKKAKKQAKKIPADKRAEEIARYLKKSTDNVSELSKQQDKAMSEAIGTMNNIVETAAPEHQQTLADLVVKSKKLLEKLKGSGDVNKIVKELKNLNPK